MVLVIGGCSKTGSALPEQSPQRGQRVRALVRAGEDRLAAAVEAVTGRLGDPESMIPTIDESGSFCDDVLVGLSCDYRSSRADGYGASVSGAFECAGQPAGALDQLLAEVYR